MNMIRYSACLIVILTAFNACSSPSQSSKDELTLNSPYATPSESDRSPIAAERLTQQAAQLLEDDPERAEQLLRQALVADLYHGPAHNNLGVLYLNQGKLYEAAHEFEWARKLMPGHPDPRLNLAMTLQYAGRIDDALDTYAAALEVYPEHIPTIQALVCCQLRHSRTDDQTRAFLERVALEGETEQWRQWAHKHLFTSIDP